MDSHPTDEHSDCPASFHHTPHEHSQSTELPPRSARPSTLSSVQHAQLGAARSRSFQHPPNPATHRFFARPRQVGQLAFLVIWRCFSMQPAQK